MGFGAGTLISAVSFELIFESVRMAKGSGYPGFGFLAGAIVFYVADYFIGKIAGGRHSDDSGSSHSKLIVPMVLAIILDGIPESIVIGLGLSEIGSVSIVLLVAIFMSNMPEAIAGGIGMKASGWKGKKIFGLYAIIALLLAVSTIMGATLFKNTSVEWLSFIHSFAGGAILMMLANSMIPEAYENGGKSAGVYTIAGFFISVALIIIEIS